MNVDYQYEPEAVPEPTSLALAGGGLLGLYWRVRRRRLAP
ncbi:MAG: PEP-CTERM sorting domain-containing protein [Armatimonadota bacterium]